MGSTQEEIQPMLDDIEANPPPGADFLGRSLKSEMPQHRVRITRPFAIGKTEVTVGQFRRFVDARNGYKTRVEAELGGGYGFHNGVFVKTRDREFNWRNVGYVQADLAPVWNVSAEDAEAFCKWLGEQDGRKYRLPTKAEWEYACRAGTTTRTYWAGQKKRDAHDYAWGPAKSEGRPRAVGQKLPNAFGLIDMCGNVWEWCSDWYGEKYYGQSPVEDPPGPEKPMPGPLTKHRVIRGGGVEGGARLYGMCSAYRSAADVQMVGFRVVC
jgi:formylglycine-generating enzyme required for sulfatase activity